MTSSFFGSNYRYKSAALLIAAAIISGCQPQQEKIENKEDTVDQTSPSAGNVFKQESLDQELTNPSSASREGESTESQSPVSEPILLNPDDASSKKVENPDDVVAAIGFADADLDANSASGNTETLSTTTEEAAYSPSCNLYSNPELDALPHAEASDQFCRKVSKRLASVTLKSCLAAKLQLTGCKSVRGEPLMIREFPPVEGKKENGRILVIGGTHGDELTSVSITFRWLETLSKHHSGLFHWRIIPAMNPDGLLKRSAERTNHNGIDLNRNLPSLDWDRNAVLYWESKGEKNPRKYPGTKPNSEPETQWLVDEVNLFKPDAIIAIHAPYGVVDFDAHKLNTAPKSLGKLRLNLLGTYPGSLGNYAGINLNIPVITLELPHAWDMPSKQESKVIWEDIVKWLKNNINNKEKTSIAE